MKEDRANAEKRSRLWQTKSLVALTVVLLVAVGVQAYFLFDLKKELAKIGDESQSAATTVTLDDNQGPTNGGVQAMPNNPNAWNPFAEMERMQEQMDAIFGQAFGRFNNSPHFQDWVQPRSFGLDVDITEQDNAYIVTVDLPGTEKTDVNVDLKDQTLTITGTRVEADETASNTNPGSVLMRERRLGKFSRSITFDQPVVADKMTTAFKQGVLTITVPQRSGLKG